MNYIQFSWIHLWLSKNGVSNVSNSTVDYKYV